MIINILEYLEATAARTPENPAFIGEDVSFSFRDVYEQARSIGSYLCNQGIYKAPVAVFMDKHPAMITAFLGVVYAGNYYIPLDNEMSAYRIQLILETAAPSVVICNTGMKGALAEIGYNGLVCLYEDICHTAVSEASLISIRECAIDTDPLYIVFTSGSTGTPKGVIASHRAVIDYIENLTEVMDFTSDTVFGNQVPLYVDACLKEIYPTLKCGAVTHLIPKPLFMFPVRLIEYLNDNGINTLCWVVSALAMISAFGALDTAKPETLKLIAFGSEKFPIKQFNRWRQALPNARFVHLYGPTEATGMSAYYEANRCFEPDEAIPIGKPFKNTEIILLTDEGTPPPPGEPGEICIRGAGLSLGYFNDPEKTRRAFVQNPLSAFPDLIYKTGDIGYVNPCGELVFVSRIDHQIKHMGHRIELAEIEGAVTRMEGIPMACAVFDEPTSRIILYYLGDVTAAEVKTHCRKWMPRYMIPHACIPLKEMPMTTNGKIDRVGLLNQYRLKD